MHNPKSFTISAAVLPIKKPRREMDQLLLALFRFIIASPLFSLFYEEERKRKRWRREREIDRETRDEK